MAADNFDIQGKALIILKCRFVKYRCIQSVYWCYLEGIAVADVPLAQDDSQTGLLHPFYASRKSAEGLSGYHQFLRELSSVFERASSCLRSCRRNWEGDFLFQEDERGGEEGAGKWTWSRWPSKAVFTFTSHLKPCFISTFQVPGKLPETWHIQHLDLIEKIRSLNDFLPAVFIILLLYSYPIRGKSKERQYLYIKKRGGEGLGVDFFWGGRMMTFRKNNKGRGQTKDTQ